MKDLKSLRTYIGLTQSELADRSEIHEITICNVESQKGLPHSKVRKRLEIVFNERINWLATCGIEQPKEKVNWEEVENSFRKVLSLASGLKPVEREQFFLVAREYLNTFEKMLNKAITEHSTVLMPIDT